MQREFFSWGDFKEPCVMITVLHHHTWQGKHKHTKEDNLNSVTSLVSLALLMITFAVRNTLSFFNVGTLYLGHVIFMFAIVAYGRILLVIQEVLVLER